MPNLDQTQIEIATPLAYTGSGAAIVVGGIGLSDWAAIAGIIGVFVTVGINLYFKLADRRANLRGKKKREIKPCDEKREGNGN